MDLDRLRPLWIAALLLLGGTALAGGVRPPANAARGHALYQSRCAVCHGARGDGRGPAATSLDPRPRDFTRGEYRIRSTAPGMPATGADIYRTISLGMTGTAMPAWSGLPSEDGWALVDYLQSLSPRFAGAEPASIQVPPPPAVTIDAIARGKELYHARACAMCHGDDGRGDGPSANSLDDSSGRRVRPYDMTSGHPKRGDALEDVFMTVRTGIEGTPMPGFEGALSDAETWDLVYYVRSLSRGGTLPYPGQHAAVEAPPVVVSPAAAVEAPEVAALETLDTSPAAVGRGAAVYQTFCVPCHGADGKGPVGANFITDSTRLAKSDTELLRAIREGKTGTVGTMPPWGKVITDSQQRDALAYIRDTFGGTGR